MTTKKKSEPGLFEGNKWKQLFQTRETEKQSDPHGNLAGNYIAAMSNLYSLRSVLKSSNLILF